MSFQRCGLIVSSPPTRMSSPSSSTLPETDAVAGRSPIMARIVVVLPHPDSPTSPIRSPSRSSKVTPWTAWSSPPPGRSNQTFRSSTRITGGRALTSAAPTPCRGRTRNRLTERWPTRSRGLSPSSTDWPTIVQARMTIVTQTPGGTIAHHALLIVASPGECVLDQPPPRDRARVAEAEEGDERLGEDGERDHQHGVRDQERRHLRQDVLEDEPPVARTERLRALHVDALADALHLRADQPGRATSSR